MVGSIAQWGTDGRAVNVAVLVDPEGCAHRYEKMHPFSFAGEHEHYQAGDKPLTVDVEGLRTTIFICYDLRFADEFWDLAPDTDCYVVVANWPRSRREHWRTLLRARAIENQAYVVGVNRVGVAEDVHHTGDSAIVDPLGRTLTEAAHIQTVLTADVDPAEVGRVRARFPFLADRRVRP
jgi:predicted amidohydrolase